MATFLRHVPRTEARAALTSFVVALTLLALKFYAYFLTNSSAIFSDALETIANVAGAGFALYALSTAHRPADEDHPYGHGKIEFLSAGFEGSMILTAAMVAVVRAADAIFHRATDLRHERIDFALILIAAALVVNGALGIVLIRLGRRTSSAALEADGHHLMTDAITSVVAILGLLAVRLTGWAYADPIAALLVALYIGRTGLKLMHDALGGLMDRQDISDEKLLRSILDSHTGPAGKEPRICSYHKLRHRHSGRYHWVDFHIVVPPTWDIRLAHEVASSIEYEIEQALKIGNATAHVEPCEDGPECELCISGNTSGSTVHPD